MWYFTIYTCTRSHFTSSLHNNSPCLSTKTKHCLSTKTKRRNTAMSAASDSSSEGEEDVMIADVQQATTATAVLITSTSDSERRYIESGNDKKVLYLLCIGLYPRPDTNNEKPLFSFEEKPWSSNVSSSSLIRPKNKDYMVDKIVRRAVKYVSPISLRTSSTALIRGRNVRPGKDPLLAF